jgi:phosphate/sulfate permease
MTNKEKGLRIIISLLVSPIFSLIDGFVFLKLWNYFIIPLGMPIISLVHGIGIMMTIHFIGFKYQKNEENEENYWMKRIIFHILYWLIILFFSWFLNLFM